MNPVAVAGTAFLIILPSELPDKTVFACLVMGSRYRPGFVFAGAAAAFAVHVALAVTAGGLLSLLPPRPVEAIAGVLFGVGAVLVWRQHSQGGDEDVEDHGRGQRLLPVAAMAFAVVFAAEFGDLTQILTVSLAARYGDPLAVGIGSVLALWVAAGGAIIGGRSLLKIIPMAWLARGAALIMLVLAGFSIVTAVSLPGFRDPPGVPAWTCARRTWDAGFRDAGRGRDRDGIDATACPIPRPQGTSPS
jgi:putative Ca2+/H+ antiporter (TMEM165/GDT1 family)